MQLPPLHIRLKRHSDGSASLTLTRADGSVTWQRQQGSLALVFPQHDLTHFAVEQALHYHGAFFGLVADGWNIEDFAVPFPRGPVPHEAREVELLVGLFDARRPDRINWTADEFNVEARTLWADSKFGSGPAPRTLTDDDLARVRTLRNALLERWALTARGTALELDFLRNAGWPAETER